MTTSEVAAHLRLTPKAVRDLAVCGQIPAINLSAGTGQRAQWRFRRSELDRWLSARERTASETRHLRAV